MQATSQKILLGDLRNETATADLNELPYISGSLGSCTHTQDLRQEGSLSTHTFTQTESKTHSKLVNYQNFECGPNIHTDISVKDTLFDKGV